MTVGIHMGKAIMKPEATREDWLGITIKVPRLELVW